MTLDPGGTSNGTPDHPAFNSRALMLDALSSGITGPQSRTYFYLVQARDEKGQIFRSQFAIGQACAVSDVGDAIKALDGLVEIVHQGNWLLMMPSTYRVNVPPALTSGPSIEVCVRGDGTFPDLPLWHDAFRHGSPLSPASGLLIWLALTEGPWKTGDLLKALGVPRRSLHRWTIDLSEAGLTATSRGQIDSVLDPSKWAPALDKIADRAGTTGMGKEALRKMLEKREESEPLRQDLLAQQQAARERARIYGLTEEDLDKGMALLLDQESGTKPTEEVHMVQPENEPQEAAETYEEFMVGWMRQDDPYPYIRAFHDVMDHPYMGHWDMVEACASMLASIRVTPGAVESYESYWNDYQEKQIPAGESPCPLLREIQTLYRQHFLWGRGRAKAQRILDRAIAVAEPLTDPRQPSHRCDFTEFPRSVYETPAWAAS